MLRSQRSFYGDYVEKLYTPAAGASRALNHDYAGAHALAEWKAHAEERKALKAELRIAVRRYGSGLMDLYGIGPAGAAVPHAAPLKPKIRPAGTNTPKNAVIRTLPTRKRRERSAVMRARAPG